MENESKAVKFSAFGIIILATVFFCMEIFVKGKTNYGLYAIVALYNGIFYGYKAIKDKKGLHIFNALLWIVAAIILIVMHIKDIYATSTIL